MKSRSYNSIVVQTRGGDKSNMALQRERSERRESICLGRGQSEVRTHEARESLFSKLAQSSVAKL